MTGEECPARLSLCGVPCGCGGRNLSHRVTGKSCPACHRYMDPDHVWWWTAYGATCSEGCARDLIREHEGGIQR